MTRMTAWFLMLYVVLFAACHKQEEVLFEIPFRLNFEISAGLNPFEKHFFAIRNVPTNLSSLRETFQIPQEQKLVIKPSTAVFSSVLQNISFEFVEEIGISVFKGIASDNDVDVFLTDVVPPNAGRSINILGFDHDVADLLNESSINFLVALRLRAPTPLFIDGNIELKFTAQ